MNLHRAILGNAKIHGDFEIITCIADKQTLEPRSLHRLCTRVNEADLFDLVYEMSRDLTDPDLLSFTLDDKEFLKAYCRPMLEPARTFFNILHPYDDAPRFYKWKAVREKR